MNWVEERPNKPCVFVARIKYPNINPRSYYQLFKIIKFIDSEGSYLALTDMDGYEEMPLEDLQADEYLILEEL
jgi:hypothetical protein